MILTINKGLKTAHLKGYSSGQSLQSAFRTGTRQCEHVRLISNYRRYNNKHINCIKLTASRKIHNFSLVLDGSVLNWVCELIGMFTLNAEWKPMT